MRTHVQASQYWEHAAMAHCRFGTCTMCDWTGFQYFRCPGRCMVLSLSRDSVASLLPRPMISFRSFMLAAICLALLRRCGHQSEPQPGAAGHSRAAEERLRPLPGAAVHCYSEWSRSHTSVWAQLRCGSWQCMPPSQDPWIQDVSPFGLLYFLGRSLAARARGGCKCRSRTAAQHAPLTD
jgi:hypothetical protein